MVCKDLDFSLTEIREIPHCSQLFCHQFVQRIVVLWENKRIAPEDTHTGESNYRQMPGKNYQNKVFGKHCSNSTSFREKCSKNTLSLQCPKLCSSLEVEYSYAASLLCTSWSHSGIFDSNGMQCNSVCITWSQITYLHISSRLFHPRTLKELTITILIVTWNNYVIYMGTVPLYA